MHGYSEDTDFSTDLFLTAPSVDIYNFGAMVAGVNYNNAIAEQIMQMAIGRGRILDFGAGQGVTANRFEQSIVCIEPDEVSASKIKPYHTVLPSIESLEKGSFDLIFSVNVIEHIEKDQQLLQQLTSLLKTSGRLYLFVPARQELFSAMDRRVGHQRRYSHHRLSRLVANSGCRVDSCKYFDSIGYLASVGLKLWGKDGWDGGLTAESVGFYDKYIFPASRAMDMVCQGFFGKNLVLTGTKV